MSAISAPAFAPIAALVLAITAASGTHASAQGIGRVGISQPAAAITPFMESRRVPLDSAGLGSRAKDGAIIGFIAFAALGFFVTRGAESSNGSHLVYVLLFGALGALIGAIIAY